MKIVLCAAAIALLAGCTSVRVCNRGETMIDIENTGWYLFNMLPIVTGDPDYPNRNECRWFENTVTLENNARILDRVAAENRAKRVDDVVSYTTDEHVLVVLLKRTAFHTSARLVK